MFNMNVDNGMGECEKWMEVVYPAQLGKCFVDEDEGDEDGEDLLGEAGDESHQEAALAGHDDHHNDDQPHANPHSPHDILNVLGLAELSGNDKGTHYSSSLVVTDIRRLHVIYADRHF